MPSGIWAPEEYAKLAPYDEPTAFQPADVFMCHQQDGRVCAGWAGCHDGEHLLAVRFASLWEHNEEAVEAICAYETDVPLWGSGAAAAMHGIQGVRNPSARARRMVAKIMRKRGD